jgi:hypothetical protein
MRSWTDWHEEADAMDDPMRAKPDPFTDPRALQILNTEMAGLVAARALSYNEAFSRATMFLSFLSATLIVIGFLVGTQGLAPGLVPVIGVLLIADLFIGMATVGRLISASAEEFRCVRGMNRIRNAYRQIAPGLEPYFITGFHDDAEGVLATYGYGTERSSVLRNVLHGLTTTIGMIATIDILVFGALCALVTVGSGAGLELGVVVGVVGFLIGFIAFSYLGMRTALGQQSREESNFPRPGDRG